MSTRPSPLVKMQRRQLPASLPGWAPLHAHPSGWPHSPPRSPALSHRLHQQCHSTDMVHSSLQHVLSPEYHACHILQKITLHRQRAASGMFLTYSARHVSASVAAAGNAHAGHDSGGTRGCGQEAGRPGGCCCAPACQADSRADARGDGGRRQAACSRASAEPSTGQWSCAAWKQRLDDAVNTRQIRSTEIAGACEGVRFYLSSFTFGRLTHSRLAAKHL